MKRGYYGIGIYHPKTIENMGTLWRSAYLFDADFIFTIGHRYRKQASDTPNATKHIPMYNYTCFEEFYKNQPLGCQLVCVEQTEDSRMLNIATHPERAVYLLGAEDYGIPKDVMRGHQVMEIPIVKPQSMNVAVAGSIVMYDRYIKASGIKVSPQSRIA